MEHFMTIDITKDRGVHALLSDAFSSEAFTGKSPDAAINFALTMLASHPARTRFPQFATQWDAMVKRQIDAVLSDATHPIFISCWTAIGRNIKEPARERAPVNADVSSVTEEDVSTRPRSENPALKTDGSTSASKEAGGAKGLAFAASSLTGRETMAKTASGQKTLMFEGMSYLINPGKWTEQSEGEGGPELFLRAAWTKISPTEIARRLGFFMPDRTKPSKNAIVSKARRLGLPFQEPSSKPKENGGDAPSTGPHSPLKMRGRQSTLPPLASASKELSDTGIHVGTVTARAASQLDADLEAMPSARKRGVWENGVYKKVIACEFIEEGKAMTCCGDDSVPGKPYCAKHVQGLYM
jgi:hypothetical protein